MSTELEELYQFLNDTRALVRTHAVDTVAGLTASSEGLAIIRSYPKLADGLLNRLSDSDPGIAGDAFRGVVNLTGDPELALRMIEKDLVTLAVATVLAPTAMFSDLAAMILSNLSRNELGCARILATNTPEEGKALYALAEAFCKGEFNYNKGASLHFLAAVLSNVSQSVLGRKLILSKEHSLLPRLLTHLDHPDRIRRAGVAGVIKNCCFEPSAHPYLLGEQVDVLSFLLLPLCGPEEFTEEEMEGMPDVCQYLPDTKTREPDPEIRKILVEALYQVSEA